MTTTNKQDKKEILVNQVLELLEKGEIPWEKPWETLSEPPFNPVTQTKYRGVNSLNLYVVSFAKGYTDPRWLTFKQAKEKGWNVKKGEHGTNIEFHRYYDKKTKKDLDFEKVNKLDDEDRLEYFKENVSKITRYYVVFNGSQIEGIPEYANKAPVHIIEEVPELESIIASSEAPITFTASDRAYYNSLQDIIVIPNRTQFKTVGGFYGTVFHEMAHSTGHSSRLNRPLGTGFGSTDYAREELVAELASMFIQVETGVSMEDSHIEQHSAYIQSWIQVIKSDQDAFYKAVKDAEHATKYVLNMKNK